MAKGEIKQVVRQDAWVVVGLASLWAVLHESTYYPFALSPAFSGSSVGEVSAYHLVYSVALVVLFAVALLVRGRFRAQLTASWPFACVSAGLGFLGGAALAAGDALPAVGGVIESLAVVFVAFSTAYFLLAWPAVAQSRPVERLAALIALSYALFSVVWLVLLALPVVEAPVMACMPLVSLACLSKAQARHVVKPSPSEAATYKALPWNILVLCIAFVYFGVVAVRAFTAMEQGASTLGNLDTLPHVVTAATGLAVALALAAFFWRRSYSTNALVTAVTVLTLAFVAALLAVMVLPSSGPTTIAKRVIVGIEHGYELMIFLIVVCEAARRRLSTYPMMGVYGIVVAVLPQLVSLDVMYQSGLLERLALINIVAPAAAIILFIAVAAVMMLLMRSTKQASDAASKSNDDWQRELCSRATQAAGLTPRELDVVLCTYRGLSAKKTAETLLVSESTVKAHLSHAYNKLGVHTKQDLIALVDSYREN